MKSVAILQSNYIPWKGYFDLINRVDEFILYDDMQYTRRDWRNRNKIKTPDGIQWLTVPVRVKGRFHQTIRETEVDGAIWRQKHWASLHRSYARASHFQSVARELEPLYVGMDVPLLGQLNRVFIEWVCGFLGITTPITNSWDYRLDGAASSTGRLVDLCRQSGATEYVTGAAARAYLDPDAFAAHGITVAWHEYGGYPEYPQLWGGFDHHVSILDLLFNCGREATRFMKLAGPASLGAPDERQVLRPPEPDGTH